MGMKAKKIGEGIKNFTKFAFTTENEGIIDPIFLPRRLNFVGAPLFIAGAGVVGLADYGLKGHNNAQFGRVSYDEGMARMTKAYNTGAVRAMKEASGGNYAVFADMAQHVVHGHNNILGKAFDDYGADAKLISALYGMGR